MTYCKQGEVWSLETEKYIILSEDRYNRRLGKAVCMKLVTVVNRNSDLYVPIYTRTVECSLWADVSSITTIDFFEKRICRVTKMEQIREILRSMSKLFGSMCYVPIFGYSPEEYSVEKVEQIELPKPKKKKRPVDEGWTTVSYKKR